MKQGIIPGKSEKDWKTDFFEFIKLKTEVESTMRVIFSQKNRVEITYKYATLICTYMRRW